MANITTEFLEKALGEKIKSFEVNAGSNLGDNYSSLLYTIDVTLKDSPEIRHLLLKCYPLNANRQDFLTTGNIFQRELCVYNTLIPALVEFQKIPGNNNDEFIKPPFSDFVFGQAVDYKSMDKSESKVCLDPLDNCIIMPDLRKTGGFRLANRLVGFDLDHSQLVIEAQAKLHSLSWAYKKKSNLKSLADKFSFIAGNSFDDFDPQMFTVMFDSSLGLFRGAIETDVKDEDEKAILLEAVTKARAKAVDIMGLYFGGGSDTSKLSDPSMTKDNILRVPGQIKSDECPWLVALHGDSWLNNMMFRYDEETGKPLEVVLVDLQMTNEGDPMSDMLYSIFTSTTSSFRKQHMNDLLKLYVDTFTKICKQFNVAPPSDFNLAELQRRFHRAKIFGFSCCLMGFPIFLNDPKNAVDMENITDDLFKEFANMTQSIKGSSVFNSRAVDVARELYEQGII